ncbi:MAG: ABC transporter substrate-binding protein [Actinomycetota bacterium]|nr:ABC transporter substrate-binding protein [Actinomycetota bacterium]
MGLATALAACGGPSGEPTPTAPAEIVKAEALTVAFVGPPLVGLDPAKSGGGDSIIYTTPAYDSLIWKAPDGELVPWLATEWEYVGDDNTEFEMTLREGVEFSDGEPFNAEAVKTWLEYFVSAGGTLGAQLAGLDTVEVVDEFTVHLTMKSPNPILPELFSQNWGAGYVASPKAIATPGLLDNETAGTGPYMLDPAQTVTGDTYTYVENPNYWNPDAQHYEKVVVRVIGDPNAMLAAVQAGELDFAVGSAAVAAAAVAGGVNVINVPGRAQQGLVLADRDGVLQPELADVAVRQAINYAIDSDAIATALNGDYASGSKQLLLPGESGYVEDRGYPYDPDKARELLEEAGYGDGFTLNVTCGIPLGHCPIVEAVASQLAEVGITVAIDAQSAVPAFNEKVTGALAPAFTFNLGAPLSYLAFQGSVTSKVVNPFKLADAEVNDLIAEAASAPADEQEAMWSELADLINDKAWFAPVVFRDSVFYRGEAVQGEMPTAGNPTYIPFSPIPDRAWYSTE